MKWETGGHPGQKEISRKGDEKRQIKRRMMCPAPPPAAGAEQGQRPRLAVSLPPGTGGLHGLASHGDIPHLDRSVTKAQVVFVLSFHRLPRKNQKTRNFAIIYQKCSFFFPSAWCAKKSLCVNTWVAFRDLHLWFPLVWEHLMACRHSTFIHPSKAKRNVVCLKKTYWSERSRFRKCSPYRTLGFWSGVWSYPQNN